MPIDAQRIYPDCPTVVRTVEVGRLSKSELLQEFQKHAISMNALGEQLFDETPVTEPASAYNLETVELQVRHLGFSEGANSAQLFEAASKLGLDLCPLEVAVYLRLHYLDQPEGRWIVVASPKLSNEPRFPNGIYLRRLEDGLWLRGYTASPDYIWDADDHFVFCRRDQ